MSEDTSEDRLELEDTVFIGRTVSEYEAMFDFDMDSLPYDSVLDCPAGPCAFTSMANDHGINATGVDIMYQFNPTELAARCEENIEAVERGFEETGDTSRFVWDFYDGVSDMTDYFATAADQFIEDYRTHYDTDRYVEGEVPNLPFGDDTFDLVLSAHLLFVYSGRFSYEFHRETLHELARVAREEVRVYPLTVMAEAQDYPRLDELRRSLEASGHTTRREPSNLALLSEDPEMLVINPE